MLKESLKKTYLTPCTGWIAGFTMLFLFAGITRYTATLLAKCLDHRKDCSAGTASTYADMGEVAFGLNGRWFISFVFLMELFAASVALVILMSDSIVALFPGVLDAKLVKIGIVMLLTPTTFPKSLSILAYGSILGIIALLNLVGIIIYDGLITPQTPGSLLEPAKTSLWPPMDVRNPYTSLGMSVGLLMSGFGGHSVFPQLYRDMGQPQLYPKVVNVTYVFTLAFYVVVASVGYIMFGDGLHQEITQNLAEGGPSLLNSVCIFLVAVNPATKYALTLNPVSVSLQFWWGHGHSGGSFYSRVTAGSLLGIGVCIVSIVLPGFHNVMSLLGSCFAFIVSVIFPAACWLKLGGAEIGRERILCWILIVGGCIVGGFGTVASFLTI